MLTQWSRRMTPLVRLDRIRIVIGRIGRRVLGLMTTGMGRVRLPRPVRELLRLEKGRGLGVDGGVRLFDDGGDVLLHLISFLLVLDLPGLALSLGLWFSPGIFRYDRVDLMSFYS